MYVESRRENCCQWKWHLPCFTWTLGVFYIWMLIWSIRYGFNCGVKRCTIIHNGNFVISMIHFQRLCLNLSWFYTDKYVQENNYTIQEYLSQPFRSVVDIFGFSPRKQTNENKQTKQTKENKQKYSSAYLIGLFMWNPDGVRKETDCKENDIIHDLLWTLGMRKVNKMPCFRNMDTEPQSIGC